MNEELCMCHAVIARQHKPIRYEWHGALLWAVWAECEEHHDSFASPSWHPRLGQLDKVTATVSAVAVSEGHSR